MLVCLCVTSCGHLLNTLVSSAHSMASQAQVEGQQTPHLGLHICRSHPPPEHCRRADGGHEAGCAHSCCESTRAPSCRWGPSHRSHSCSRICGASEEGELLGNLWAVEEAEMPGWGSFMPFVYHLLLPQGESLFRTP